MKKRRSTMSFCIYAALIFIMTSLVYVALDKYLYKRNFDTPPISGTGVYLDENGKMIGYKASETLKEGLNAYLRIIESGDCHVRNAI